MNKQFIILGNMNAITYKEVFPLIKDNKIWLGVKSTSKSIFFGTSNEEYANRVSSEHPEGSWWKRIDGEICIGINNSCWFTNLDHGRRHEPLSLMTMADNIRYSKHKQIRGQSYPKYDNYDAIEVCYVDAIPSDYEGAMGVPISFLDKYCPEQFDIIGASDNGLVPEQYKLAHFKKHNEPFINGKKTYKRILIKHKGDKDANNTKLDNGGGKQFIILSNMNAITYKEVFPLIKDNKIWLGATNFNNGMYFQVQDEFEYSPTYKFDKEIDGKKVSRVPGICWFTNIDHGRRHEPLSLMTMADNIRYSKHKQIRGQSYPKYDNYDAIEVCYVDAIPSDYEGAMGVPISFLDKYCPEQFDIIDLNPHFFDIVASGKSKPKQLTIAGQKDPYARVLIKHKGDNMKRLHFGCGSKYIHGYEHNDVFCTDDFIDHKCHILDIKDRDEYYDLIYSRHVMEHFSAVEGVLVVRKCYSMLKEGGILHLILPNLAYHVKQFNEPGDSRFVVASNREHAMAGFYGWQGENPYMIHKYGYTPETMSELLSSNGFTNIELIDCRDCDIEIKGTK